MVGVLADPSTELLPLDTRHNKIVRSSSGISKIIHDFGYGDGGALANELEGLEFVGAPAAFDVHVEWDLDRITSKTCRSIIPSTDF
jgi:hypothetical protein